LSIETYLAGEISIKNFDRDSNLKIFLLPGLEAQKVEKHCPRPYHKTSWCSMDLRSKLMYVQKYSSGRNLDNTSVKRRR